MDNQFLADTIMPEYIKLVIPDHYLPTMVDDLTELGQRTSDEIYELGKTASANEPVLIQYDEWGNRIDEVQVSEAWNRLKSIAAEEGLISIAYSREFGEYSRIFQMAKLFLYTPSSAIYTCPLAMADGAARLIETICPDVLSEPFAHLTTQDPSFFWTAGQWMTEKEGGSDVSQSSTIARHIGGDKYRLYGEKWFTSAITSEMAMTLARIEDDQGETIAGNRGLSLFYLRIRDDEGNLNDIEIYRLKDKLGTRALPTAELKLMGSRAELIGEVGYGVKEITTILNTTRIYNAVSSISYMHRALNIIKDYATKRHAFGKRLIDLPLHRETLVELELEYINSFLLVFYTVELMGKVETDIATDDEQAIFRLLTPLIKLYTGKQAVAVMSEALESLGGMGYIEETDLPELFRDSQVFPIWEGTTNILSLDVIRAITKEQGLEPLLNEMENFGDDYQGELDPRPLIDAIHEFKSYASDYLERSIEFQQLGARKFSFSLARCVICYQLLRMQQLASQHDSNLGPLLAVGYKRLISQELIDLIELNDHRQAENEIVLGSLTND